MYRLRIGAVVLAVAASAGCKKEEAGERGDERAERSPAAPEASEADTKPVSEAELPAIEEAILTQARANQTRECARPLLRGTERPGPADEDVLALLDPDGTLAGCYAAIEGKEQALRAAWQPEGVRGGVRRARPLHDERAWSKEVQAVAGACDEVPAMLRRAVSHRDACSPYLPGRRGQGAMKTFVSLAWAVMAKARERARGGDVRGGLELLLDYVRLGQDFGRGGSSFTEVMLAAVTLRVVAADIGLLLGAPALEREDLEALEAQLARLADSEVHPSVFLRAKKLELGLYSLLPLRHGRDWVPPGGFPADREPPAVAAGEDAGDDAARAAEERFARMGLIMAEELDRDFAQRCPEKASLRQCLEGLQERARLAVEAAMPEAAREGDPTRLHGEDRQQVLSALENASAALDLKYVLQHVWRTAALQGFRTAVASRLSLLEGGPCPSRGAAASARLGRDIAIEPAQASGVHTVLAPAWFDDIDGPADSLRILDIACAR